MKPTPIKVTILSTRLPDGTDEPQEGIIFLDVLDTLNGETAGTVRLEGGATGFESFRVNKDLSNFEEVARDGWPACAGTPGSWPRIFVPAEEMSKALELFRSMRIIFANEPADVATVYVAAANRGGRSVVCALLNYDAYWRSFTTTVRGLAGAALCLRAAQFAVEHTRIPLRLRVVAHAEELRSAFAGETGAAGEDLLLRLRAELDGELKHHVVESVTSDPLHPAVAACLAVAEEAVEEENDLSRARLLRLRRSALERNAAVLLAGHGAEAGDEERHVVTVYASAVDDVDRGRTVMFALLTDGGRWKAVGYASDERIDPVLARAHIIAYALDHLKQPCYVHVVDDDMTTSLHFEHVAARSRSMRAEAIWEACGEGLASHPLLTWRYAPDSPVVRACNQAALKVAEGRSVTVANAAQLLEGTAPHLEDDASSLRTLTTELARSLGLAAAA